MEGLVAELVEGAREEMARVAELGGAVEAVDYMKAALVESHRERWRRIESGELTVVGMNRFTSTEPSPLTADADGGILVVDPEVEAERREALERWRAERDQAAVDAALAELARVARDDAENIMPATIDAARAGATTGEWAQTLREVFGEYRAPTGVGEAAAVSSEDVAELREEVERVSEALGRRLKFLVGKPGLDGHSNGAEQIAVRARDAGMDVVYEGIRLTPSQIATSAAQEGVHVIGLSILSGSHAELIPSVLEALADAGVDDVPVVVGGIIPEADAAALREAGRRRRLHAQGLGPEPDDARHHRAGRGAPRGRHPAAPRLSGGRATAGRAELGARLRERDLSAAPAVLNLVESRTEGARAQTAELLAARLPRRARRRGARPTSSASPARPASASPRCCRGWWRSGARATASVAVLAVDPSSRRSGGALLGDRARIERDPGDRRAVHPLDRRRRPARRTGAGHPRGGHRAGRRVRRGGDRDRRRRPVRDRGRRRRRHGGGRRPAGLGRRAAVPEGRDHGDPRRARRDQGRPRAGGDARAWRICARRCARWADRHRGPGRLVGLPRARGHRRARRRARPPPRRARPADRGGCAAGACTRWPTSPPSTASAGCGRSAAAARPSAGSPTRIPAPMSPRSARALEERMR